VIVAATLTPASANPPHRSLGWGGVPMPALPLGSYVNDWYAAQATAAAADQFVIYRHEWFEDGVTLGPYGNYHLQRIIEHLPGVPFQVVIQVDEVRDKINQARKTTIVNRLLAAGIADAAARVIIGYPRAEGLFGDPAAQIFFQTYSGSRGGGGLSGYGGSGGFGGSPFGGSSFGGSSFGGRSFGGGLRGGY
jgi:hypothetical protein